MSLLRRKLVWVLLAIVIALPLSASVSAQSPNLLQNPGFERPYVAMPSKENCRLAAPWVPYYYEGSEWETSQGYRFAPEYKAAFRDEAPYNRVRNGELSQQYFHSYGNFQGGVLQQVSNVPVGKLLRFEIWAMTWSCDNESKGNCGGNVSGDPSPMHLRIGIDPTGGTDAMSDNVVWSAETNAYDAWELIQVEAVSAAKNVTVFVYSFPVYRSQDNNVYLDDASLTLASARTLPTPTPGATASSGSQASAVPTPIPSGSNAPFSGVLVGSRGGAYARYEFATASASQVTLNMQVLPFDGIISRATGFEVYGPSGLVVKSEFVDSSNTARATFTPVAGASYLVQVYNYLDGMPITYALTRR